MPTNNLNDSNSLTSLYVQQGLVSTSANSNNNTQTLATEPAGTGTTAQLVPQIQNNSATSDSDNNKLVSSNNNKGTSNLILEGLTGDSSSTTNVKDQQSSSKDNLEETEEGEEDGKYLHQSVYHISLGFFS